MRDNFSSFQTPSASKGPEFIDTNDEWRRCSPRSLRGHIANAHFQARTLRSVGIPLYDIEIAQVRGIGLGWVAKRAFEKLSRDDGDIQSEIDEHALRASERSIGLILPPFGIDDYRSKLAKTVRVIAAKGLAQVPWDRFEEVYPGAASIPVDLAADTTDLAFKSLNGFPSNPGEEFLLSSTISLASINSRPTDRPDRIVDI